MSDFPQVKFGICKRCGRRGNDVDSDGVSSASTGYYLKEHEGEELCQLCINWLVDKRHQEEFDDKLNEEERFRQRAGVQKA